MFDSSLITNEIVSGGNAKTLMFVNISPVDYNTDETIVSLTLVHAAFLIVYYLFNSNTPTAEL